MIINEAVLLVIQQSQQQNKIIYKSGKKKAMKIQLVDILILFFLLKANQPLAIQQLNN